MHPWRNWIAHQIPILTVGGSNPFGCTIQNAVMLTAFFTCTPTDSIPVADAIGAKRNNRYYARVARYEPFGCTNYLTVCKIFTDCLLYLAIVLRDL